MRGVIQFFSDRFLLILFFLSLIVAAVGLTTSITKLTNMFSYGERLMVFSGLVLILKYSGLVYEHKHVRVLYVCISVILIGILFKLEHWPYSSLILTIGYLGMIVTYALRFLSKSTKQILDWLKVIWVIVHFTGTIFIIHYFPYATALIIAAYILFILLMSRFLFEKRAVLLKF